MRVVNITNAISSFNLKMRLFFIVLRSTGIYGGAISWKVAKVVCRSTLRFKT